MEIINHSTFREIIAADGCLIRRRGSEAEPAPRANILPADTLADFEELTADAYAAAKKAATDRAGYKARLVGLIRQRYDADDEAALLRKTLALLATPAPLSDDATATAETEATMAEFAAYNAYVEQCKPTAREGAEA